MDKNTCKNVTSKSWNYSRDGNLNPTLGYPVRPDQTLMGRILPGPIKNRVGYGFFEKTQSRSRSGLGFIKKTRDSAQNPTRIWPGYLEITKKNPLYI